MNRRSLLKTGSVFPFFPLYLNKKNSLEKLADEVEKNMLTQLSTKNPVITTLKGVNIFLDYSWLEKRNVTGFYGWINIKLNNVSFKIEKRDIVDVYLDVDATYKNRNWTDEEVQHIIKIIDNNRDADYGASYELKEKLNREQSEHLLEILRKRTK